MSDGGSDEEDVLEVEDPPNKDLRVQVAVLNAKVRLISYLLKHDVVHRFQFEPVKLIAYGFAGIIISSVLVAVLSFVIKKVN